jgi:hypothetical protein
MFSADIQDSICNPYVGMKFKMEKILKESNFQRTNTLMTEQLEMFGAYTLRMRCVTSRDLRVNKHGSSLGVLRAAVRRFDCRYYVENRPDTEFEWL